jgi:regulator of protease activity HflC (stomatin/prohibitin superfamily)
VVSVLSEVAEAWGIRIHRYEIKNIVPPGSVKNAMERQMGAERERRALIARSEGARQALINESEGRKIEMINNSEGEMRRRVNEAEGKAQEILALATATAESIRTVGAALSVPGGEAAMKLRLAQEYLKSLGALGRSDARVVLPADLLRVEDLLGAVGLSTTEGMNPGPDPTLPREERRVPEALAVPAMGRSRLA